MSTLITKIAPCNARHFATRVASLKGRVEDIQAELVQYDWTNIGLELSSDDEGDDPNGIVSDSFSLISEKLENLVEALAELGDKDRAAETREAKKAETEARRNAQREARAKSKEEREKRRAEVRATREAERLAARQTKKLPEQVQVPPADIAPAEVPAASGDS